MPFQKFFLSLDVSCGTLAHLFQFIRADCGLDDGMPFRFYNGVADTIHNVVRTVLGRIQSIESRPFPFGCVHKASVYTMQLFFEFIDFLEQIAYGKNLVNFLYVDLQTAIPQRFITITRRAGNKIDTPQVIYANSKEL